MGLLSHDCQLIELFPSAPCGVVGVLSPKLEAPSFVESVQTPSLHLKYHRSCQVIQIFPLPSVLCVVYMHHPCDGWHFGDLQHQKAAFLWQLALLRFAISEMVTVVRTLIRTPTISATFGTFEILICNSKNGKNIEDCDQDTNDPCHCWHLEIFDIKTTPVARITRPRLPKRGQVLGWRPGHPPSL